VVFVRKRFPEIQYQKASITDGHRDEFGQLVETTTGQIEAGEFWPRSGIRFPMNGCTSCPHLGLCLGSQPLDRSAITKKLIMGDLPMSTPFCATPRVKGESVLAHLKAASSFRPKLEGKPPALQAAAAELES